MLSHHTQAKTIFYRMKNTKELFTSFLVLTFLFLDFPGGSDGKAFAYNMGDPGSISWRSKWQPTPVFLPEKSHGRRSLVGCSPWGHRVGHD